MRGRGPVVLSVKTVLYLVRVFVNLRGGRHKRVFSFSFSQGFGQDASTRFRVAFYELPGIKLYAAGIWLGCGA